MKNKSNSEIIEQFIETPKFMQLIWENGDNTFALDWEISPGVVIDIAVIMKDSMHGFKVIGDGDEESISKLPSEITEYNKVFNYMNVMLHESHYKKWRVKRSDYIDIPDTWGVWEALKYEEFEEYFKFYRARATVCNSNIDLETRLHLLTDFELFDMGVLELDMLSNIARADFVAQIRGTEKEAELHNMILETIINRGGW